MIIDHFGRRIIFSWAIVEVVRCLPVCNPPNLLRSIDLTDLEVVFSMEVSALELGVD